MATANYMLGVDLGQSVDPSALVLLEHETSRKPVYQVRAFHRFPLGMSYTEVARRIAKRVQAPPLAGRTRIAIDATGGGAPVIDVMKEILSTVRLFPIVITGGTAVGSSGRATTVPKRDLINTTSLLLEQRRIRIAASLPDTDVLVDEFLSFRRMVSEAGHDTYAAAGGCHDDLVLALSLALWTAERNPPPRPYRSSNMAKHRIPGIQPRTNYDDFYRRY